MSRPSEPVPPYGVPIPEAPGIVRVVAPNPGPMTQHGTNTWIVAPASGQPGSGRPGSGRPGSRRWAGGAIVIDPGPDDAGHVAAVLAAAGRVGWVLLTHGHADHSGAAAALRAASGAPLAAHPALAVAALRPDRAMGEGDMIAGLRVLHTPGHAADHLCFAGEDGVLFTGDHVMGWASTAIAPPEGDMAAYLHSLRRLDGRGDRVFLSGHGAAMHDPASRVATLLRHRLVREAGLVAALRRGPASPDTLVASEYPVLEPRLARAAGATLLAHLRKLRDDGVAEEAGGLWRLRSEAPG